MSILLNKRYSDVLSPGAVLVSSNAIPAVVLVQGFPESTQLITSVAVSAAEVFQVSKALGDAVYVCSHGQDVGRVNINGVSLLSTQCNDLSVANGFDDLVSYYAVNKLSSAMTSRTMTLVNIAGSVLRGYLIGLSVGLDGNSPYTATWTLSMLGLR